MPNEIAAGEDADILDVSAAGDAGGGDASPAPNGSDTSATPDANGVTSSADDPEDLMSHVLKAVPDVAAEDGDTLEIPGQEAGTAKAEAEKQETDQPETKAGPDAEGEDPAADAPKDDGEEDADTEVSTEITPKEFQRMNSKTRRKVRALQAQAARVTELEMPARAAESLNKYLHENNINNDDFNVLLTLGAALQKGDFKTFLDGVQPYIQLAQEYVGQALPADLREMVHRGQMTEDAAKQVARQRMDALLNQDKLARQVQTQTRQHEDARKQATEQAAEAIALAVSNWENTVKSSDPDYARKQHLVQTYTKELMLERGVPRTPAQALEYAKEAYRRANELTKSFVPKPKAVTPGPNGMQRSNTGHKPEPKTLAEAALQGLMAAQ